MLPLPTLARQTVRSYGPWMMHPKHLTRLSIAPGVYR